MAEGEGGLTADEQALSVVSEAAGRVRASDGRGGREKESPALVMGTRESPPVRSRDQSRGGGAEEKVVVSPARRLCSVVGRASGGCT